MDQIFAVLAYVASVFYMCLWIWMFIDSLGERGIAWPFGIFFIPPLAIAYYFNVYWKKHAPKTKTNK
jgi:hypothetical protein